MNDANTFAAAATEMGDGMARICRLYGVSGLVGRLYAVLFVSSRPLALDELCESVGAAKSSVSVALRKLVSAKVARRLPPRVDRRDFYEAVTDPWAIFADWTSQYFRPELDMLNDTGGKLRAALEAAPDAPGGDDARALRARLDGFSEFSSVIGSMLFNLEARPRAPAARRIAISIEGGP